MNEMADGHDRSDNQRRSLPPSSSPMSSPCCSSTQTWLPVESTLRPPWMNDSQTEQDEDSGDQHVGMQTSELRSSRFYEELFCTSQASVPLAGALLTSSEPQGDVVKRAYLGKLEQKHRRYFVLRAGSHIGPSRLEWYKSQEKFTAMEKYAGKDVPFGANKQGVIYLRCCLGVSRTGSSRKGHTVALYGRNQTMVLVMGDQQEQEEWYQAIKKLMEEERKDEEHGEGFDEEDDGYCTLPPAPFFKEVWPVTVKPRCLGRSKSLAGETHLCLTATSLILVRVGACSHLPSVTIPLLSVRRFGHLDGSFFLELGRSAPDGPGEIWMEARDQGNPGIAQHIHEAVRETVQSLRALPDFSQSPTSNHSRPQAHLISKRSRPKYRDKLGNVRRLSSHLALPTDIQTSPAQCYLEPHEPDKPEPESILSTSPHLSPFRSQQSCMPETGSYMKMKIEPCSVAAHRMKGWELGEEEEEEEEEEAEEEAERLGYMMMSPQVSHSSSLLPQDDYVTMASPNKHHWPPYPSPSSILKSSFHSSTSYNYSPPHPSNHQTNEHSRQNWLATSQSQTSASCSTPPFDDMTQEQKSAQDGGCPAETTATSSPVWSVDGSDPMPLFVTSGPGYTRPVQGSLSPGTDRCSRLKAVPDQSAVRRNRLSFCLPSCLKKQRKDPECL